MLAILFQERLSLRKAVYLGGVLGVVGMTEVAFPGARLPYATHTLMVTIAVLVGGLRAGLVAAAVVTVGAFGLLRPLAAAGMGLAVVGSAFLTEGVRRVSGAREGLAVALGAGLLSQGYAVAVRLLLAGAIGSAYPFEGRLETIPANGFGVMLLFLVLQDAQLRARSERHRAEAERAHALVAEAELNALRARVHPHFLFNALTSIAALCPMAPAQAEAAVVRLGQLMRRVLETRATAPHSLSEELEQVRGYLEIESLRLGERVSVVWHVNPNCAPLGIPPFALQTLVENAIQHGIAAKLGPGTIAITVRRYPRHILVAVRDDGAGMPEEVRRVVFSETRDRMHGLLILNQQLMLLYDRRARLRLFSRADAGTLAVFVVPSSVKPLARQRVPVS